jgi:hypothetical protein
MALGKATFNPKSLTATCSCNTRNIREARKPSAVDLLNQNKSKSRRIVEIEAFGCRDRSCGKAI